LLTGEAADEGLLTGTAGSLDGHVDILTEK